MIEKLPEILNPTKSLPAFVTAAREVLSDENAGKNLKEKIGIFLSSFLDELNKIDVKESEIVDKTDDEIGTMNAEKEKEMVGKFSLKEVDEMDLSKDQMESREAYGRVKSAGEKALDSMPAKNKAYLYEAFAAVEKSAGRKSFDDLGSEQALSLGGFIMSVILEIKREHKGDPKAFAKDLKSFIKESGNTGVDFGKILGSALIAPFKNSLLGIGMSVVGKLDIGMLSIPTLKNLKDKNLEGDNLKELANLVNERVFPNTNRTNVEQILKIGNDVLNKRKSLKEPEVIAELVYLVDDRDFERLIELSFK